MKTLFRSLEYLVVRGLLAALGMIPYPAALGLARAFASVAYRLAAGIRRRTIAHLRLAYGSGPAEEWIESVAREVFGILARHVAEVGHVARRRDRGIRVENGSLLAEAHRLGRGVIVVSAHLGCFVRMAAVPARMGIPVAVIMKQQRNERILRWGIDYVKRHFNIDIVRKKEARDLLADLLVKGCVVGLFADQHPRKGGFPTVFFGRPVRAAAGPAIYAKRYGCPLLAITSVVDEAGVHVLRFEGPIPTAGSLEEISQRWMSILEARIREHPGQWMWMHRRWREAAPESKGDPE